MPKKISFGCFASPEKNSCLQGENESLSKKHQKNKSTYVGVVICPKRGLKGYKCILTSTYTPDMGKVGVYAYYVCQHRHSIGKKQIYDKTCILGKDQK